jgi:phosphoglycerate dehydrogenase-like enzyme
VPILGVNASGGRGYWALPDELRAALAARLPPSWELAVCDDAAELGALVRRCRAVVGWPFPAALARRAPDLAWVHFFTSGVPDSWREAPPARVTASAGANADSVAEHGLFLVLAAVRGARAASFARWDPDGFALARPARELGVLVYGHGEVGRRLAVLLEPIVGRVTSLTRTPRGAALAYAHDTELLPLADVIVLAVPLTGATRALFTPERFFSRLRPDAILVNLARGELLDEAALLAFLAAHPARRYLADVAHPEPYPDDGPLLRSPQVLLTPHVAGRRADAWRRIGERTLALVDEILPGLP